MTRHIDPLQFKSDERQLWAAVILRHIEDATGFPVGASDRRQADRIREEARVWLTRPSQGFDDVCYLAGLDPDWVRKGTIQKIEQFDRNHRASTPVAAPPAKTITHNGETHTIGVWARITGVNHATIRARLRKGKSSAEALSAPRNRASPERTLSA